MQRKKKLGKNIMIFFDLILKTKKNEENLQSNLEHENDNHLY